ncbi:sel1 repeat family protein [Budviciaceae bacterium CWB-B4]|uniref:Sel1 repeat family protein n=1 Tax=Limnobaculum xujianqingii TaxID=2738837 RepID=A0A9D7AJI3_9GAMM|nr:tetratricopeptide repeat protein [Limnobaculum xujianqingii]MBK5073886.1 sel1 repeat family protein [Limnobaculum xujianqingii]MBK5177220.1 sel1 repeat family protein [Limnobaculum xujianqingii]
MLIKRYHCALILSVLTLMVSGCVDKKQNDDASSAFGQPIDPSQQNMLGGLQQYLSQIQKQGNAGDQMAQRRMGDILIASGEKAQGLGWIKSSAISGNVDSQLQLADMYANGVDMMPNYDEAFIWYKKAAEQGNARAQGEVASAYLNGKGVEFNLEQSIYWDSLAAKQGIANSQNNLGAAYTHGEGVPQDPEQAVYWYTKAANQGVTEAQFNLAGSYYLGQGVAKDDQQAYAWYATVAKYGDSDIAGTAKMVMEKLTPTLSKAGKLASSKSLAQQYISMYSPTRKNLVFTEY